MTKLLTNLRTGFVTVGTLLSLCCAPSKVFADLEVVASVQIHAKAEFEAPLGPYGTWVEVGSYGRCWRPVGIEVGWRPYCEGEWVWTDCGWYWQSDEPWGWACYHYGYWVMDPAFGWVWVPGVEWAPAWVSWRVGGGYIGWAPLPPPGFFFAARPKPGLFVFVDTGRFGGPLRPSAVLVKNTAIFGKTAEVGGVKRESRTIGTSSQRVMVNNGPKIEELQRSTHKAFAAVPIQQAATRTLTSRGVNRDRKEVRSKPDNHDSVPQSSRDGGHNNWDDSAGDRGRAASDSSWGRGDSGHGHGGGGHGRGR